VNPLSLQLKLISIGVAVLALAGGGFWAAWSWRGSIAETEVKEGIAETVTMIQAQLNDERAERAKFQEEMGRTLAGLSTDLRSIRRTREQVATDVAKDRADNQQFYSQPLPQKGRDAWIRARTAASAEPGSPPASSASSVSP
jgi:hypothetical protein